MAAEERITEARELDRFSADELYALLDLASRKEGLGLRPSPEEGNRDRGRARFLAMLRSARSSICASARLKAMFTNDKEYGRAEIAAVVAETVFQDMPGGVAMVAALLVARQAWHELCGE